MNNKDSENKEKNSILRWAAAVIVAVLIAYLRVTGYLPESAQEAEGGHAAESAQETESGPAAESAQESESELAAESAQGAESGPASESGPAAESSFLTPDGFCRTTYEVFVNSFCDSDGDGTGDLRGLLSKLDYINDGDPASGDDLGMTGLWLMPVFPSPTYHKYDVTDFKGIDPSYGTLEDLDALLSACHERGMTVILDLAVNHTSTSHPWFQEAARYLRSLPPGRDAVKEECPYVWYYQFAREQYDGYVPLPDSEWYYEARFWSEMPDLNLTTGEVRQELKDVIDFWLDRGVDGFRLDAVTSYYTDNPRAGIEFTGWLTDTAKERNPSAYIVGEAWTDQYTYAQYYKSGIDSLFDFAFAGRDGLIARVVNRTAGLRSFAEAMVQEEELYASMNPYYVNAPFYTNHDMDRGAEFYAGDGGSKAKIAEALNLLMTGNAFVYYGEELGMKGAGRDEARRAPMYWSDDPHAPGMCAGPPGMSEVRMEYGSWEKQKDDPASVLNYIREAVRIRESLPVIARGRTARVPELEEDLFCGFVRCGSDRDGNYGSAADSAYAADPGSAGEGDVLILINIGDAAVTRHLPDSVSEFQDLRAALYTGEENASVNGREITVPSGGILFLKKP